MSVQAVREYLKQYGLDNRIREFEESSATVELAAEAVGVIPARIAKTLSFKTGAGVILIVMAGDTKIDNRKFKDTFQSKATMLSAEEVLQYIGHGIGGVCPFAVEDEKVIIYLDESIKRFDSVFPAAGSSNSCLEVNCEELFKSSQAKEWVDVAK